MKLLRAGRWITGLALVLLAGVYVRALVYTPIERMQGLAQKIFYVHVPAAIWAETAMIFVGLASVFYLFLKDPRLDRFAAASAEVGTVFAAIVLTTEKDAVRLTACDLGDLPIAAVPLVVGIEPADPFRDWLLARLSSARAASPQPSMAAGGDARFRGRPPTLARRSHCPEETKPCRGRSPRRRPQARS